MEKENKNEKQTKTPLFVHPAHFVMYAIKQKSMEHKFNKMRKENANLEQNRVDMALCAEEISRGEVKAENLLNDFEKLDQIYAARSKEIAPIDAEITKQIGAMKAQNLTKEEMDEELKPLLTRRNKTYKKYSVQGLMATSLAATKLYDTQSKVMESKKDKEMASVAAGLSLKGALLIAGALTASGVAGGYAYVNGMFSGIGGGGKSEMAADDYSGSTVDVFNLRMDANTSYVDGIDTSSPEFIAMKNSPDYQAAYVDIVSTKQAEGKALQERVTNQIIGEYKEIDRLNDMAGYNEGTIHYAINDFTRILDTNGDPLESYPAFLTRYKNYLETQNVSGIYTRINTTYRNNLPQSVVNVYDKHNVTLDYEKDVDIIHYLDFDVHEWTSVDPITGERSTQLIFSENVPEGTTIDFMKEYYNIYVSECNAVSQTRSNIFLSQDYHKYNETNFLIESANKDLNDYYSQIGSNYSNQIQTHINNIDTLQADYITQSEQIQNSAAEQIASLQQSSMGLGSTSALDSSIDSVLGMEVPQTGEKSGLIQSFVDSALDTLSGAQDAITNTIDDIARSL